MSEPAQPEDPQVDRRHRPTFIIRRASLAGDEHALLTMAKLGPTVLMVSDDASYGALGMRVAENLQARMRCRSMRIHGRALAIESNAGKIIDLAHNTDALIAVGSGTVNDLVKYAAHALGKPYGVFATASSMNGYASRTASLTVDGHKKTLPATLPRAVWADMEVLRRAPLRLTQAGIGDTLAIAVAQCDWLLSHFLLGTPYDPEPFAIIRAQGREEKLFATIPDLLSGNYEAHLNLFDVLTWTGIAMNVAGGSYPASQSEHLLVHYLDMFGDKTHGFHGEEVAHAVNAMSALWDEFLARETLRLRPDTVTREDFIRMFGEVLGPQCWAEFEPKRMTEKWADAINRRLATEWPAIRDHIKQFHRPHSEVRRIHKEMRYTYKPRGMTEDKYYRAVLRARFIRNRFTILDAAALSGAFDAAIARLGQ
ncbi:MAG TPA: iron-containing alcohol dehydrogenase [Dongiaceae bacterium]|jgi:glycerol-1-phosphate dehydrogenase [NAD(P)+]|nr:iron-containing alcohol dehydrogenase [Dongiaceae bacterium]